MKQKNILIFLMAFVVLFALSGCNIGKTLETISDLKIVTETAEIEKIGAEIASYEVPVGYYLSYGVSVAGYQAIGIDAKDSRHILLAQAPEGTEINLSEVKSQVNFNNKNHGNDKRELRVVGHTEAVIDGQTVTLTIGEGINSDNLPYREIYWLFEGRNGPAGVLISSPTSIWDQTMIDRFLASITR